MHTDELLLSHIRYTSQDIGRRVSTRHWPYLLVIGLALGFIIGSTLT